MENWTMKISRWNDEKLGYDVETRHLDGVMQYPDYDVAPGESITGIGVYPAIRLCHIWIRFNKAVQS